MLLDIKKTAIVKKGKREYRYCNHLKNLESYKGKRRRRKRSSRSKKNWNLKCSMTWVRLKKN
jgi:hypothetical protein